MTDPRLVLVLGGQKSGKSGLAQRLAIDRGGPVVVLAPARASDPEMAERIAIHRADRPTGWTTVETFALADQVRRADDVATVVVDALDTWLADAMASADLWTNADVAAWGSDGLAAAEVIVATARDLADACAARTGPTIVIAGQPGLGAHALGAAQRRWVDLHGRVLQALSARADRVLLVVAGRTVELPPADLPPADPREGDPPAPAEVTPARPGPLDRLAPLDPDDPVAQVASLVDRVRSGHDDAAAAGRARLEALAMPRGALGHLGELGVRLCAMAGACPPPVPSRPVVVVAAGDHGVHARGVTQWPREVTSAMVATVAAGRAAVSVLAEVVGARVEVLDVAVADDGDAPDRVHRRRVVRAGTRDLSVEPAMTMAEAATAVLHGAALAEALVDDGHDLLATGDLGIANTTASACLVAATGDAPASEVVGPGAANDAETVARKVEVVAQALARHGSDRDPLGLLASLGGAEHAALVGVMLAGAARHVPVVLDGLIAGAAALVAVRLAPAVADVLVAGHRSTEPAASLALARLGLRPLLDLELRLGEGTGAVLAIPVVRAAAGVMSRMATLDEVTGPSA